MEGPSDGFRSFGFEHESGLVESGWGLGLVGRCVGLAWGGRIVMFVEFRVASNGRVVCFRPLVCGGLVARGLSLCMGWGVRGAPYFTGLGLGASQEQIPQSLPKLDSNQHRI